MALHKPPAGVRVKSENETASPLDRKELVTRVASSVLIVVIIVSGIILGDWVWDVIASVIALGSLWELYKMIYSKYRLSRGWGLAGGALMLLTVSAGMSYAVTLSIMAMVVQLVFFTEIIRRQVSGYSYALWNVGGTLSGLVYVVLPWSFMILLRSHPQGHVYLLTIFFCTWSCDVGAYLIGMLFGNTPLCDRVSPSKSWEGFAAGVIASVICASVLPILFKMEPFPLVILGALCGVAGQFGDLAESILKREAKIKDAGSLIPGHGGFLDRFDSILINATLTFFVIEVIG
jgi:phosphatidate cytidylyltransferase